MSKAKKAPEGSAPPEASELPTPNKATATRVYTLFAPQTGPEGVQAKRLTLPPIIKPREIADGVMVEGKVLKLIPSPISTYKSELLWMQHTSGKEFLFPVTAIVQRALKTEFGAVDKSVGATILIRGLGQTRTADGQRTVNLFEVFVVPKA